MNNKALIKGLRNVGNLHQFAELFGFDWEDSEDWSWHDVAVKMADIIEEHNTRIERTCTFEWSSFGSGEDSYEGWYCSVCGENDLNIDDEPPYCPYCGSKVVSE